MKLFNIAKFALAAVIATMASSCNDDGYWEDATSGMGSGVSFRSTSASASIVVGDASPVATATLMRGTSKGSESVELTQTSKTPEIFNVPASVTFEDGKNTVDFNITVKDGLEAGNYSTVVKAANAAVSGNTTFTFSVSVKTPAGVKADPDWQSMGEGTFREDMMTTFFNVENVTYKVQIDKDVNNPGMYRVVNPYDGKYPYNDPGDWDDSKDHYLVINAMNPKKVYIEQSHTGMAWSNYGEVVIWSIAGLRVYQGWSEAEVDELGAWGTLENGIITFPKSQLLIAMMDYNDAGLYAANANGKFAVALPGYSLGDYSLSLEYVGRYIDNEDKDYAVAQVELTGKDAAGAKVGIVKTVNADEAIAAVKDSTVQVFEIKESGEIRLPVEESGRYTIVAVSTDADGGMQETAYVGIKFTCFSDLGQDENKGWKSLGEGIYTDNLVCNIFTGMEPTTYAVEIQEKEDNPGYYRMVNPYGANFPYNEEGDYDPNTNYYVEIDATNPNCVMIPYQETGLDWGYGMVMIYSYASYYYENGNSLAEIEASGHCGKLADGVISFPEEEILFSMAGLQNGSILMCPRPFNLILPGAKASAPTTLGAVKHVASKRLANKAAKATLNLNQNKEVSHSREFRTPSGRVFSDF